VFTGLRDANPLAHGLGKTRTLTTTRMMGECPLARRAGVLNALDPAGLAYLSDRSRSPRSQVC